MREKIGIKCYGCSKIRLVDIHGMKTERYLKYYPFCRSCSAWNAKDKISKGWFKRGTSPWNKGLTTEDSRVKKYVEKSSLVNKGKHNSKKTEFKKGLIPWNKNIEFFQIRGEKHGNWKGDSVGYSALHLWIKRRFKRPISCRMCGEIKKLDLSNISGKYKRDLIDWEYLCRKCHIKKDGILNKGWRTKRRKLCITV